MALRKIRDKLKRWLLSVFTSGSQSRNGPVTFFRNAERVVVNDSNMISVQGNQHNTLNNMTVNTNNPVFNIQVDHTTVTQIMNLLSQHVIRGAAHDDSTRTPPPRCQPDTRVKLISRIITWFDGQAQQELLLWITGPAGVGKSAIIQTFAEYLAKRKSLGASVFLSRPNKRNNPHGIFITIAYQLATRIEEYRKFLTEMVSLDPSLLYKGYEVQFSTFIVEPFAERKIGAGGNRWGILLDGLDELQGEDAQCNIIHLISNFAHEHRDTPLIWMIASRPESHISNTFEDDEMRRSCWTEYIPIDSMDAREDVERFLRSSFKAVQKKFRQSVSTDWPNDTDFLKITSAASGLFVYAERVMQFIRDPDQADPARRLEVLLSVIDRSTAVPTRESPFIQLDALYHEILSSIPSAHWPMAKLLLDFTIHEQQLHTVLRRYSKNFAHFRGMSIILGLNRNSVYACLTKCRSALSIPDWGVAHKEKLTFLHESFSDYLQDSSRSGEFCLSSFEDVARVVVSNLIETWNKCSSDIDPALVESAWHQYCSKSDNTAPSSELTKFHAALFRDIVCCVARFPEYVRFEPAMAAIYVPPLQEVNMIKLCYCLHSEDLAHFVDYEISHLRDHTKLRREEQLGNLKFSYLDWKGMSPAYTYYGRTSGAFKEMDWILNRPRSSAELKAFVSKLEEIQRRSPEHAVSISGGSPSGRVATFRYRTENGPDMRYVIPYPESS